MSARQHPLTLATVLAATGVATALTLPGGTAFAQTNPPPADLGNGSIASGNQALLSVNLPVDVCGISIAVLGNSNAGCAGGATATVPQAAPAANNPSGIANTSVGSGNNVSVPVSAPVDVCGVSVAVLGSAQSGCQGSAAVGTPPPSPVSPGGPGQHPKPGHPNWPPSGPPGGKPVGGGGKHRKPPWHHRPHHLGGGHNGGSSNGGHNGGTSGGKHSGHGKHSGRGKSSGNGSAILTTTSTAQSGNIQPSTNLSSGTLPTTGINLFGIAAAATGSLGVGAGSLVVGRRRRRSPQEA